MKYLISEVDTYRVETVDEAEALGTELRNDSHFTVTSFGYKTKQVKSKGEVIDEYQLVTVKKVFNEEKEPGSSIEINYEVD